jgi:hypothetical protein
MNLRLKKIIVRIFDKSIKAGRFFRFMVILSAIWGLIYTVFNVFVVFGKQNIIDYISTLMVSDTLYFYKENLLFFVSTNRLMYVFCIVVGVLILYGCHLLFRGYKWGLLFYTIAKIFQVIIPIIFLGYRALAVGDVMIILFFLVYYYYYSFTHNIEKSFRRYNQIQPKELPQDTAEKES